MDSSLFKGSIKRGNFFERFNYVRKILKLIIRENSDSDTSGKVVKISKSLNEDDKVIFI